MNVVVVGTFIVKEVIEGFLIKISKRNRRVWKKRY